jgi:hypothetical protein
MTPEEIKSRIQKIAACGDSDPERAHYLEDALLIDVLKEISTMPLKC